METCVVCWEPCTAEDRACPTCRDGFVHPACARRMSRPSCPLCRVPYTALIDDLLKDTMVALLRGFAEQFRALVPYSWIKCMDLKRSVLTQLTFYQRSVIRSALEQMLGIVDGAGDGEVHASLERKGVVDAIDAHVCMEASRKSKIVGVPGRLIIDRKTLYQVRFEMNSQYANYACIIFEFR